jgi:carbon storage regulator
MLVLNRKKRERIFIGEHIIIEVLDVINGKVKIGIIAPKEVIVAREEIKQMIKENKK